MKPKTKKTLIIVAAVAIVAAIVYFAFFRKKQASSIIDGLTADDSLKAALKNQIAVIESTWTDDAKAQIETNAKAKGRTYQQQLVAEAAYALYSAGTLTYDQMTAICNQLLMP